MLLRGTGIFLRDNPAECGTVGKYPAIINLARVIRLCIIKQHSIIIILD